MTNDSNIIYGVNPVLETIKVTSRSIQEIFISAGSDRGTLRLINSEAVKLGIKIVWVAPNTLDALVGHNRHQWVASRIEPYQYLSLDDVLVELSVSDSASLVLVLDGLTDPRNFGALLRTAEAVGIRFVFIPKDRSVDVTPVAVKASAGAAHHVRIAKITNLRRAISSLKGLGYWIAGLDARSGQTIYDHHYPAKLAIVLGSEGKGIRPGVRGECDFTVAIPMIGRVESLNVSVAGAVFFYEVLRQKHIVGKDSANPM